MFGVSISPPKAPISVSPRSSIRIRTMFGFSLLDNAKLINVIKKKKRTISIMTKIRELITNLTTLFFFFWTLVAAFAPFLEYEVFFPFRFEPLGSKEFDYIRLIVFKSSALFTLTLFTLNFWRRKRPLSAIAPVVVMCYSLVFFEILAFFTLEQFTDYKVNIYLIMFFASAGGLLHYRNIKESNKIFQ